MKSKEGEVGSMKSNINLDENAGHTILIVDDEKAILNALKRSLADEKYRIVTTDSPQEALSLISANRFSVIISDYSMPYLSGADLLAIVMKNEPRCIRVMLTGAADTKTVPDQVAENILNCQRFITKPWDDEQLRQTIRECIQQYESVEQ